MPIHTFSLEQTLEIAKKAIDYAQHQVLRGATQLENNNLSSDHYSHLAHGVEDVRNLYKNKYLFNENQTITQYENIISTTSKYSLGNCFELAIQSLDYILNDSNSDLNAELFFILGGDHAFLVLNRNEDSFSFMPSTWGENAVICDPWANKFYKATDYTKELKNYYNDQGKNMIEDFKRYRHFLFPVPGFDTKHLVQLRSIPALISAFSNATNNLVSIFTDYKSRLEIEMARLQDKYGKSDKKYLIISGTTKVIDQVISDINVISKNTISRIENNKMDYHQASSERYQAVHDILKVTNHIKLLSKDDVANLSEHRSNDRITKLMKFFGIPAQAMNDMENMTQIANDNLSNYRKRFSNNL